MNHQFLTCRTLPWEPLKNHFLRNTWTAKFPTAYTLHFKTPWKHQHTLYTAPSSNSFHSHLGMEFNQEMNDFYLLTCTFEHPYFCLVLDTTAKRFLFFWFIQNSVWIPVCGALSGIGWEQWRRERGGKSSLTPSAPGWLHWFINTTKDTRMDVLP